MASVPDMEAIRYVEHETGVILPQSHVVHNPNLPSELFIAAAQAWQKFKVGDIIHPLWVLCIAPPYYRAGEFYVPVLGPCTDSLGAAKDILVTPDLCSYRCASIMTAEFRLQIIGRAMSAENTSTGYGETWEETLSNILIRSAINLGLERYPLFPLCNERYWECDQTVVAKPPFVASLLCVHHDKLYMPAQGVADAQFDILHCHNLMQMAKIIHSKASRRFLFLQFAGQELVLIDFCTHEIHLFDEEVPQSLLLDELFSGYEIHVYPEHVKGNAWAQYLGTLLALNPHVTVHALLEHFFTTMSFSTHMASWLERSRTSGVPLQVVEFRAF